MRLVNYGIAIICFFLLSLTNGYAKQWSLKADKTKSYFISKSDKEGIYLQRKDSQGKIQEFRELDYGSLVEERSFVYQLKGKDYFVSLWKAGHRTEQIVIFDSEGQKRLNLKSYDFISVEKKSKGLIISYIPYEIGDDKLVDVYWPTAFLVTEDEP